MVSLVAGSVPGTRRRRAPRQRLRPALCNIPGQDRVELCVVGKHFTRQVIDKAIPAREELPELSETPGIVTARDDSTAPSRVSAEILNDFSGRSRDRTCDFVRVKDALYR